MRTLLKTAVACAILALVLAGCNDGEEKASGGGVTEFVGTFAGVDPEAPASGDFFIAVAIDASGRAEVYMCDGFGHSQSFTGTEQDGKLDLESQSGEAHLTATVNALSVEGKVALDGQELQFTAVRAEGPGGLYTVFLAKDGNSATGRSERGNSFEAEYRAEDNVFAGSFATAEGDSIDALFNEMPGAPEDLKDLDSYRVVILDTWPHAPFVEGRGNPLVGAVQLAVRPPINPYMIICSLL